MKTATLKLLNLLHEGHSVGWLVDQINDFTNEVKFADVCVQHAKDDVDLNKVRLLAYQVHEAWHD